MERWGGYSLREDDLNRRLLCDLGTRACRATFGWKRGIFRSANGCSSADPAAAIGRAARFRDSQRTWGGVLRSVARRALARENPRTRSHVHVDRARVEDRRISGRAGSGRRDCSPGSVYKDEEVKRKEYVAAGVVEYWIIDPEARTVDIHEVGRHFAGTDVLTSELFEGFSMPLAELFAEK